ncbi:hypothetical protein EDB83DRAFT_2450675 [Lactarius deliciosus]|nr:hypothetical protein EDB83DRAFT_2450675 [Lactarius deliciosus]
MYCVWVTSAHRPFLAKRPVYKDCCLRLHTSEFTSPLKSPDDNNIDNDTGYDGHSASSLVQHAPSMMATATIITACTPNDGDNDMGTPYDDKETKSNPAAALNLATSLSAQDPRLPTHRYAMTLAPRLPPRHHCHTTCTSPTVAPPPTCSGSDEGRKGIAMLLRPLRTPCARQQQQQG